MRSLAVLILASSSLCSGQTPADALLPSNVHMYEPKNLTPDRAERVANFVRQVLNIPGLLLTWDNVPHAFVIRGGDPKNIETVEALLKRFDVPETKIELTVHLIRAFPTALAAGGAANAVPSDLKSAIDEMKGAFNYERYTLWDEIVLQIKSNGEVQGVLPGGSPPTVYNVSYSTFGPPTESKTLNLSSFQFSLKYNGVDSHIKTDLTIHEGQKLVLGKIRLQGSNADLFLVLSTKVY